MNIQGGYIIYPREVLDRWYEGSGSLTFLGFRHYRTKSRKGNRIVGRKTEGKRLNRALKVVTQWGRANRHIPRKEQHEKLTLKMRGHYAY
jgi:hypothetical protein